MTPDYGRPRANWKGVLGNQAAFTLVELLVVVAIISVLAAMLLPTLNRARAQARQTECMGNLRQSGLGMAMYAADYGDWIWDAPVVHAEYSLRYDSQWRTLGLYYSLNYLPSPQVMFCRTFSDLHPYPGELFRHYFRYNWSAPSANIAGAFEFRNLASSSFRLSKSGGKSLVTEFALNNDVTLPQRIPPHNHGWNVLYGDSHVKWLDDWIVLNGSSVGNRWPVLDQ